MLLRVLLCVLVLGALLLGIAGCYGNTASLDPVISWKFTAPDPQDPAAVALPYIRSGGVLIVTNGSAVAQGANDQIISYRWSQDPDVGTFTSTDTINTTWAAPILQPGEPVMPVTLTLVTKTLYGGQSTNKVNLLVLPPG